MARAKRARKAETPTQPSFCLQLRAPHFYPTDRIQQVFAAIKAKSEANGYSITVDFRGKGFFST